jgi:[NiFe] hydrogenase diaphorase moiety small subunit
MSKPNGKLRFTVDGRECFGLPGQTILEAALDNGIYIPSLCRMEGLPPAGSCRICTVRVAGRYMPACTQPVGEGMIIENKAADLEDMRKTMIEMLFVEGNHMCPTCEKSGNCQLQALAYRYQMLVPRFPYQFPLRKVEPTGPRLLVDHNRCIKCQHCVGAIKSKDGKNIFSGIHRSKRKTIAADPDLVRKISDADAKRAMDSCPVGAILKKEIGFAIPIGKRKYDTMPIGSDVKPKAS